jgi:hypothetical protein
VTCSLVAVGPVGRQTGVLLSAWVCQQPGLGCAVVAGNGSVLAADEREPLQQVLEGVFELNSGVVLA